MNSVRSHVWCMMCVMDVTNFVEKKNNDCIKPFDSFTTHFTYKCFVFTKTYTSIFCRVQHNCKANITSLVEMYPVNYRCIIALIEYQLSRVLCISIWLIYHRTGLLYQIDVQDPHLFERRRPFVCFEPFLMFQTPEHLQIFVKRARCLEENGYTIIIVVITAIQSYT